MNSREHSEKKSLLQTLLLSTALAFTANAAWAQDAADANTGDEDAANLDRVTVTGSRISRSELEGAAPVIVIDQQQMAERGYTTVYEALADLSINNGYKFEGAESALFTPDVQTINLRGFGVGNTLTLINGRRLANYPAAYQSNATVFSYGAIPVAAIERIEILATAASAIYGSDAVAGVVNIILRSDIDETTVNVLWGTPTETKSTRSDTRIQFMNGKTFTRGSYTFTGEYLNRSGITGGDYNKFDSQQDDYPYGTGVYDRALLTLDWFVNAFFGGGYRDPGDIMGTTTQAACDMQTGAGHVAASRPVSGNFCGDPNGGVAETNFQNEKESISLYFNGQLEVGDNGLELFTDLLYYKADSKSNNRGVYIFEDILDWTTPDSVGFGWGDWYLAQRRFNSGEMGMDMSETFEDEAWTAVVGARGIIADKHDWEFSANYSEYEYNSSRPWLKWRETIDTFLGDWQGVSFFGDDWWSGGTLGEDVSFGLGDPNNLYGAVNDSVRNAFGRQTYGNKTTDLYLQFTMTGDLMEMSAGPLSYALVVEYEDEDLTFIPDALIQQKAPTTDASGNPINGLTGSGWYRLTGYQGDGDRQRYSIGGELRIPVIDTLTLNLAARWDDYDSGSTSFGSDVTPSASIEWRPTQSLLVRAGYSESFRAPDMAQVFVRTGFYTGAYDWINCYDSYVFQNGTDEGFTQAGCDTSTIFAQRVGSQDVGYPALDAETGDTIWAGIAWDITDNLSITVDYTRMSLEQRVIQQSSGDLLDDEWECFNGRNPVNVTCDQVGEQIIRQVDPNTGISYIDDFFVTSINQAEEEADFIDIHIQYALRTERAGDFIFQGDYNNMLNHTSKLTPESEEVDLKNDPINGGWDFRSSFIGSLTWRFRDFDTTVTAVYRGGTTLWRPTTAGQVTGEDYYATENWWVDSYLTWNLTASYYWTDKFLTRLRVVNLFDDEPPKDDTFLFFDDPWYNIYTYPGAGIGRYAALEAQYTF